jgi:hypothetical protein
MLFSALSPDGPVTLLGADPLTVERMRDMLLRLHGMAHTVINGASMSVPPGEESLPELAFDVTAELELDCDCFCEGDYMGQAKIKRREGFAPESPRVY